MPEQSTPPPWEILSSEELSGYAMFGVRRDRVRSPRDGSVHDYDVVVSADGVTVLALTDAGQLVLVDQYRVPLRGPSLELPSGVMDDGEDPVQAGLRELREETGYEAADARALGTLVLNPSWQTTLVHVVLARGAHPAGEKELDEGEDTRVRLIPSEALTEMVARGELTSSTLLAAVALFWATGPREAGRSTGWGVD